MSEFWTNIVHSMARDYREQDYLWKLPADHFCYNVEAHLKRVKELKNNMRDAKSYETIVVAYLDYISRV